MGQRAWDWGRAILPTAKYCSCALLSRRRDAKSKNEAILQGGRLGGKRGVKAVQVEVFLPGTDDPPSLGRYPALCFVTRGCSSFGFVGLGILIITFILMFQMYFGGEGDFEVANR